MNTNTDVNFSTRALAGTNSNAQNSLTGIVAKRVFSALPRFNSALVRALLLVLMLSGSNSAWAQTVCAEVKIEIAQELTLERQAFEAKLLIENTLTDKTIENINVVVEFSDDNGDPVIATSDASDTSAKFFIRTDVLDNISDVSGSGSLAAGQTANVTWLIIPAPGASEGLPSGKLYFVGAKFNYILDGIDGVIEVAPDSIYVKPMPLLSLDYFLPRDVFADNPLTQQVEAIEPFTLGVRVQNNGSGTGNSIKIESAQPEIVENEQGLLIDFQLLDSYVQDAPVNNSLLIDFGDIPANESKMGRWTMTTSLSGRFTEFTAEFTHADELGGALTSLLDDVNTHFLLRNVLVDAPGRDNVKDFLSFEVFDAATGGADGLKVFESNSTTTDVNNQSGSASLGASGGTQNGYPFSFDPAAGFAYAQVPDPFAGSKLISRVIRSDGKELSLDNVWFSKTYNKTSKQISYYLNLFDFNTPGNYSLFLNDPVVVPRAPIWQSVPLKSTFEGEPLGFIVQASDPDGSTPILSAENLPADATFTDNNTGYGSFQWTPSMGQVGQYTILLIASDGVLETTHELYVTVNSALDTDGDGLLDSWELEHFGDLSNDGTQDTDGDGVSDLDEFLNGTDPNVIDGPSAPSIVSPALEAVVSTLNPELVITNSEYSGPFDVVYGFELYRDESFTDLVDAYYSQPQGVNGETSWSAGEALAEDTNYYWRANAYDSFTYSPWVDGRFTINSQNQAPSAPVVSYPEAGAEVADIALDLSVMNSVDADGDVITYKFYLFDDLAAQIILSESEALPEGLESITTWQLNTILEQGRSYYWRADAMDEFGASSSTGVLSFSTAVTNSPPQAPVILLPANGARVGTLTPTLSIGDASDDAGPENLVYLFEVDEVSIFDSSNKISSPVVADNAAETSVSWLLNTSLIEDETYYWRVRARDADGLEGPWVVASFVVNASNTAPPVPVIKNPGDQSQVITVEPKLEVFPVEDSDGDAVQYEFELYSDPELSLSVGSSVTSGTEWMAPTLTDDRWYYWRARAIDETDASSAWTGVASFFVNENNVDNAPEFTWLLPEGSLTVTEGDDVTLRWTDEDLDSSASITIHYADNQMGANLVTIGENINEDDDGLSDTLVWSTQNLAAGNYYFFALIEDESQGVPVMAEPVFYMTVEDRVAQTDFAELITPIAGTTFSSNVATFTWTDVAAEKYQIRVGSEPGGQDIKLVNKSAGVTQATISNLPIDGSPVYVTIWTKKDGIWRQSQSVAFTSHSDANLVATLVSPSAGTSFSSNVATFIWTNVGADNYQIRVGSEPGGRDIRVLNRRAGATQAKVRNLPIDGSPVYVTIWTKKYGTWRQSDSVAFTSHYDANLVATLTSPSAGTIFSSNVATFRWTDVGAGRYQIRVGSQPGGRDIRVLNRRAGATQAKIRNLPLDGSTVYVTIWTKKYGRWRQSEPVAFTSHSDANLRANLTSPSAGTSFSSNVATFIWTDVGAVRYQMRLGSQPGGRDIKLVNKPAGVTQATIGNLPIDGSPVYVTMWTKKYGRWRQSESVAFTSHNDAG